MTVFISGHWLKRPHIAPRYHHWFEWVALWQVATNVQMFYHQSVSWTSPRMIDHFGWHFIFSSSILDQPLFINNHQLDCPTKENQDVQHNWMEVFRFLNLDEGWLRHFLWDLVRTSMIEFLLRYLSFVALSEWMARNKPCPADQQSSPLPSRSTDSPNSIHYFVCHTIHCRRQSSTWPSLPSSR